jgi:hypothetical protein
MNHWSLDMLTALRRLVERELCQLNSLLEDAFPVTEEKLVRNGRACGILYCLHGPRNVRLTAIYDSQHDRVLFYDSTGQRMASRRFQAGEWRS